MANHIYRNAQMEHDLINKINDRVNNRFNGDVPPDIQKRIAAEMQHIIDSGHGTLFAAVASLAEFSAAHGYPVGVRGLIGNLYIAHLLGIAVNDPMKLGLRYEGFLGLDGNHAQPVTLNAASEVLNGSPGASPRDPPGLRRALRPRHSPLEDNHRSQGIRRI